MKVKTTEVKRGLVGILMASTAEPIIRYMMNCKYLSKTNLEKCAKAFFENKEKGEVKGLDWALKWDETGAVFLTDKAVYRLDLEGTMCLLNPDGTMEGAIEAKVKNDD